MSTPKSLSRYPIHSSSYTQSTPLLYTQPRRYLLLLWFGSLLSKTLVSPPDRCKILLLIFWLFYRWPSLNRSMHEVCHRLVSENIDLLCECVSDTWWHVLQLPIALVMVCAHTGWAAEHKKICQDESYLGKITYLSIFYIVLDLHKICVLIFC